MLHKLNQHKLGLSLIRLSLRQRCLHMTWHWLECSLGLATRLLSLNVQGSTLYLPELMLHALSQQKLGLSLISLSLEMRSLYMTWHWLRCSLYWVPRLLNLNAHGATSYLFKWESDSPPKDGAWKSRVVPSPLPTGSGVLPPKIIRTRASRAACSSWKVMSITSRALQLRVDESVLALMKKSKPKATAISESRSPPSLGLQSQEVEERGRELKSLVALGPQ